MKSTLLALAAAGILAGSAAAQTTNTQTTGPGSTSGMSTSPNTSSTGSTPPSAPGQTAPGGTAPGQSPAGASAAGGSDNQAVATTAASAATPAQGHNSFTLGQARSRIAHKGFTKVVGLKKDHGGVWRGMAMKDGSKVPVWLDYKGNVGQGT